MKLIGVTILFHVFKDISSIDDGYILQHDLLALCIEKLLRVFVVVQLINDNLTKFVF